MHFSYLILTKINTITSAQSKIIRPPNAFLLLKKINFLLQAKVELHELTSFFLYACSNFEDFQNKLCHGCLNDVFLGEAPTFLKCPHYFMPFGYQKVDHVL